MPASRILEDVKTRLEKLNIYELRQVARAVGVHRPADGKKSRVEEAILSIAQGITAPEPPSLRGAPPKSQAFDEQLVADIKTCREYYLALNGGQTNVPEPQIMRVADSAVEAAKLSDREYSGILDIRGDYGFLRVNGAVTSVNDVFVHESFINRFGLREGDLITCIGRKKTENQGAGLIEVISVNGQPASALRSRRHFSDLTHTYPRTKINLAHGKDSVSCRIIDLFAPLALGQRAVICAPKKSGKSALIKQIASGISLNYPQIKVVVILVDERPEEVTDFKRSLNGAQLFCTTFDMPRESHISAARLGMEYAKRQTEEGKDVIVLFDGITRFSRAYGTADGQAFDELKKLLFCACNAEEGGSLTIVSTLSDELANPADCAVYNEFSPLANMVITLSAELAARRVFPAIDVKASYADREDALLSAEELSAANNLRAGDSESILKIFKETSDNGEIISRYKKQI